MKFLNFLFNIGRYYELKAQISEVEQEDNKSEEAEVAVAAAKKGLKIGVPIITIIVVMFIISFIYGMFYVDLQLPKNSDKTTCWTDTKGVVYTPHLSLKGMSLEDLGMNDPDYKIGTVFYVYVDRNTDLPIYAITKEEASKIESIAVIIIISSCVFFVLAILVTIIIIRRKITKPWIQYTKKYNIR